VSSGFYIFSHIFLLPDFSPELYHLSSMKMVYISPEDYAANPRLKWSIFLRRILPVYTKTDCKRSLFSKLGVSESETDLSQDSKGIRISRSAADIHMVPMESVYRLSS
jgi:hypothetical protein